MPQKAEKKAKPQKREKLFHPQSRKADQLVRAQHRKSKLEDLTKARKKKQSKQVDILSFFYDHLPPEGVASLTLPELHSIIRDVWLTRHDAELEEEKKSRRKGRPKSAREENLEAVKLTEAEHYRTGFEVIDLTDVANVALFRQWDRKDAAFIKQLRYIRVCSSLPDVFTLSRPGLHPSLKKADTITSEDTEMAVDEDEAPLLLEPPSRFSSTIMTMDEIPA
ncbi:hypothetical protein NM688_g2493 [Phlebia brevispora]|uniref:Uncharacterized protein n=1 Tax=Phlebia brevispora TaxID=194682 RepID=A0ACC1T8H0_9APHY|nr:hypothetical protein NM688_g2493 [Phlebia brevispora]